MKLTSLILRAPDGGEGGGGGTATWRDTLPDEFKNEPMLQNIPDIPTLTKNYVNAQRLIGTKRLPMPEQGWDQKKWDEFYAQVGRPETFDKYGLPEVKDLPPELKFDDNAMTEARKAAHSLGLTDRQFKGMMELYMKNQGSTVSGAKKALEDQHNAGLLALKNEWGEKFDGELGIAKSVIQKFGGENSELMQYLDQSGMGSNVQLIKLLNVVGKAMLEDTSRGGEGGAGLQIGDKGRALQEIATLKQDQAFLAVLGNAQAPGHREAVARWSNLHSIAFPGKQQ